MTPDLLALCALSLLGLHALCSGLLAWDGGRLAGEVSALVDWCASLARTHARQENQDG